MNASPESPAEYVELLRAENRALRRQIIAVQACRLALERERDKLLKMIYHKDRALKNTPVRYFDPMDVD